MSNERLRGAISSSGLTYASAAEALEVDPKTVERWISKSRTPHRRHRKEVAELLGKDETYLWPVVADDPRTASASRAELVEFFPTRSAVPTDIWASVIDRSKDSFDLLAYAALFLPEHLELVPRLVRKAKGGVRVRVLLGDPEGQAVSLRGREEGLGDGMASRVRLSLKYFDEAATVSGLEVRLHDTALYASIVRGDDMALINAHVYGAPAAQSPVLHLQRVPGGRVFDHYLASFERVWSSARPTGGTYSARAGSPA